MVNKELVKKKFAKSFKTYDKNAIVQKHMAEFLLKNLINVNKNFDKVLEIGYGTGLLTKEIKSNLIFKELFLNDLNEDFRQDNFLLGDCEEIEFPKNLDLIISNATFQWTQNFPLFCEKVNLSLGHKGVFAFTIFEEGNFYQIKEITGKSLKYYTKFQIEEILNKNFQIIYSRAETINLEFDSAKDILKHLKSTGVNALEKINWTKKDLQEFGGKYNNFKTNNGKFVLTYKPLYFICAKIDF